MNRNFLATHWPHLMLGILLLMPLSSSLAQMDDFDPWERYNRAMFEFNQEVDRIILEPTARVYQKIVPDIISRGVSNFFSNIGDVHVIANDLLQLRFDQALRNTTRLVYNTTFGMLGFVDVATHMELPKTRNDFGLTLGRWGVGNGYYLVLPLLGPTTTRDVWTLPVDGYLLNPIFHLDSTSTEWALTGLFVVDTRASVLEAGRLLDEAALDPYLFQRDAFLQRRLYLLHEGNPPAEDFDFDFEDDEFEDLPDAAEP
jgi:phospholipid-binding lipoprotein MlaA